MKSEDTSAPWHPFLNPKLDAGFLDLYVVRLAVLRALTCQLDKFSGRLLDVGAGNQPYRKMLETRSRIKKYVPLDLADNGPYKMNENVWDGITMPFKDEEFDCAIATEVLEHCPDASVTLGEVHRVLKPDGLLFLTVPFLWPLHDCPNDEYRYTPWSMERHLGNAGFQDIRLWPTGGWDASLAQALGLWVRRRPMGARKRKWLSHLLLPVVKRLVRADRPVDQFSHHPYLMPGIAGTARAAK